MGALRTMLVSGSLLLRLAAAAGRPARIAFKIMHRPCIAAPRRPRAPATRRRRRLPPPTAARPPPACSGGWGTSALAA